MGAHLQDVRSDLSAIHRVDELERLPGPRFYALVYRLSAYPGLVQTLARSDAAKRKPQGTALPAQMSGTRWLAAKPDVLDQISPTPLRR